jgi:Chaperone of endosialidase
MFLDNNGSATNFVDMNVSADGKLTINSSGDETIIHSSDSFNVAGHNGTTIGLKLAGVLVTATASELNYVDTTPGTAEASKALVLDANRDIDNINVLTADTVNVSTFAAEDLSAENITTTGNVGINTSDLTYGLQVNHSTGNVLRLTFNDNSGSSPTSRADFTMDNANNLSITASNSVNIAVHNGVDTGLRLAGTLVTATATELNYVDTTPGTAEPSKALVLNSSKDITGINSISMNSLNLTHDSSVVDTVGSPLTITRTTSGTPANGLGVGMSFRVENSANSNVEFGNVAVVSSDITAGSEDGQLVVNLLTNGVMTECLRLNKENLYVEQLFETSDRRVKENFEEVSLQETYNNIMNLKLTKYNYIGHNTIHTGLIAQEVEEIIPSAVNTEDRNGIEDFKSVSNREVTNTLLGAVQYLAQKLETLQAEFEAYKQAHS